jgi:hypothetical protein
MNARPTRARRQSLCGTARGLASKDSESVGGATHRRPCRYTAIWACKATIDCSRRMSQRTVRRMTHRR